MDTLGLRDRRLLHPIRPGMHMSDLGEWNLARELKIDPPKRSIIDSCRAENLADENLFQTAERLLIFHALAHTGNIQLKASRILGVSSRALNYRLGELGWRRIDR